MTDALRLNVGLLEVSDAGELLTLQRAAYLSEAQIYDDLAMPPLVETLKDLECVLADRECEVVGMRLPSGRLLAVGRITRRAGTTAYLSRLCVTPDQQGKGLGSRLLAELEAHALTYATRFELATGSRSEANLHLYAKRGYVEYERVDLPAGHTEVHLTKPADASHRRSADNSRQI